MIDGPQKQGIRDFEKFTEFEGSVKDFKQFYDAGVMGATDIDFVYERNSAFLFMEEKVVFENYLDLPVGQAIMLDHLLDSLYEPSKVFIVGRQKMTHPNAINANIFYYLGIKEFLKEAIEVQGNHVKCKRLDLVRFIGPLSPSQFTHDIKKETLKF